MNEVLQTNVFFWITSIAVIILTVLLIAVLVYVLKIVRKVNRLTDTVEKEGTKIVEDVSKLHETVKENAEPMWDRVKYFIGVGGKRTRKRS
jgi:uncharacterized protein YoxC